MSINRVRLVPTFCINGTEQDDDDDGDKSNWPLGLLLILSTYILFPCLLST